MLVLSRAEDEVIVIGGCDSGFPEIRIVVTRLRSDKVKLGIDAPKEMPVHRLEVFEAIEREAVANNS